MAGTQSARQRYAVSQNSQGTMTGKVIAVLAVVMVVAIVIAFVRFYQARGDATVQGKTATVEQIDDHTLRLWADVTRTDVDAPTYCIVKALNYSMAEVGRREVAIPAGGPKVERIEVDITTTEPAVSADVYGCSPNIPFYLKVPERSS